VEDKDQYLLEIKIHLESGKNHGDLFLSGIEAEGWDLRGKTFIRCDFSHAVFRSAVLTDSVFRLCFFDFVRMDSCTAHNLDAQNLVLAGAKINSCDFEGSNLIQVNFNNAICRDTVFNSSDLYNSRFIGAVLENVGFVDCNLKNVDFKSSRRENVNFKYSNLGAAFLDEAVRP
jgi:uncharacterized protein YjbI with pentapeptide repeats